MEERKRGGASGFDASEAEEREIRLEQARTARIEAEERSRKKESRRASRKALGRFAKRFPLKVILPIAAVALVAIFGFVLPYVMDDDETQYVTESDLKSAVDIDNLSTIDYVYHGIAEKHSTFLWQDRVDYRVKYQALQACRYRVSRR